MKANNVSLPRPVHDIMNRWVLQMGFPVVTIDTTTGEVSQKHFLLDPESNVTVKSPYKYATLLQYITTSYLKECSSSSRIYRDLLPAVLPHLPQSWMNIKMYSLLHSYEWLIPVRWMKSDEVQEDVWWLMEKTGMTEYRLLHKTWWGPTCYISSLQNIMMILLIWFCLLLHNK